MSADLRALDEAADWLMRLSQSNVSEADKAEWERWRTSSPERHRAWARAQLLLGKLGGLPPALAMSALDRPSNPSRRVAVAKLATLLALLPTGWGSWKLLESQHWTADVRSAVGERRALTLADGSQVTLNTDTAIDIRFDTDQRLIQLRQGEILVQTAPDTSPRARPFRVSTHEGRMQALGTRFTVREYGARTQLAVLEGAVRVDLANAGREAPLIVNAGQRTDFSTERFAPLSPANASLSAWGPGHVDGRQPAPDRLPG